MAKTYTSTIKIDCWKEHTCAACGGVFSYQFKRTATGQGGNADVASANARKSATRIMERDVDLHPCPTCGLYQPDMIGQTRAKRHNVVFWLMIVALLTILILRASYALRSDTLTWVAVGVVGLAALVHLSTDLKNLNQDPPSNRQIASERITKGEMRHTPGRALAVNEEVAQPPRTFGHRLALALLLVAVLFAAAPELLRMQQHWPLSPDAYPPVAGPGDKARIYMPHSISSIKGFWRGKPNVALHPADNPKASIPATATTNQNDWGSTIYAKSSEKNSSSTPWVEIQLPEDEKLAGKTVAADIDMDVTYPESVGSSNFRTTHFDMRRSATLNLAAAHAGSKYDSWWWQCTSVALLLVIVCGYALKKAARGLQARATPTRILVPEPTPVAPVQNA